ncbi:MAG: hypothetical protein LBH46_01335 [Rickettsiales bacterium]|jgi:hypothetical protein|nr:hypothetical protein [Rickettsiales bacterium]
MENINEIVFKLINILPHSLLIMSVTSIFLKKLFGADRKKRDDDQDKRIDIIENKISSICNTQIEILDILTKPKEGKK